MHIIYSYTKNSNFKDIISLEKFCKKNKIRFYISNYIKKLNYIKIDGIHIPSSNKSRILSMKNKIDIIGTAHNQLEYSIKKNQGCSRIFLSCRPPCWWSGLYRRPSRLFRIAWYLPSAVWYLSQADSALSWFALTRFLRFEQSLLKKASAGACCNKTKLRTIIPIFFTVGVYS